MKEIKRKSDFSHLDTLPSKTEGSEISARLPWDYSPPTLAVKGVEKYYSTYSTDVQLTVRSFFVMTRKQLCMLAGIALYDVSHEGLNLGDWMILEYLYSSLLGNKQTPYERKDPKEFELSLLIKILLLSGTWMGLDDKKQIPEDIKSLISKSKWVPKERTISSWKQSYSLRKYIEVRAVPLNVLLERADGTERYSSYCKGYGESSHMGRRQKTRPSAELDGEPVDIEKDQTVRLDLLNISHVLQLALLEIKYSLKHK